MKSGAARTTRIDSIGGKHDARGKHFCTECLANAERTDNPQHKNTWLRLAECYRVLIERAKQEHKEQAF